MKSKATTAIVLAILWIASPLNGQKIGVHTNVPGALLDIQLPQGMSLPSNDPILNIDNNSGILSQRVGLQVESNPGPGWGTGAVITGGHVGAEITGGRYGLTVSATGHPSSEGQGIECTIEGDNAAALTSVKAFVFGSNTDYKNGLWAVTIGSGNLNRAVYGYASGATTNWAGYFDEGNVYVKHKLSIGNLSPVFDLDVLSDQAVGRFTSSNSTNGAVIELRNTTTSPNYIGAINFGDGTSTFGQLGYRNDHSFTIRVNNTDRFKIISSGLVGIGRTPVTNRLEVEGNASKTTAGEWIGNSDARLKKNITPLDPAAVIEKMLSIHGITYEWNDDVTGADRPEGIQYGFTAQDIQATFPTLVTADQNGYLQTAYGTYDAMTVEAIRYLYEENKALKEELQQIREMLSAMKSESTASKL